MTESAASPEAEEIGSRIRAVDGELDALEQAQDRSVELGMRSGGGLGGAVLKLAQEKAEDRHAALLEERAGLVDRLKRALGDA